MFLFFPSGILSSFWNVFLWVALVVFTMLLAVLPKPWGILFFLVSLILRAIYTMGLGPALLLLGTINVSDATPWRQIPVSRFYSCFFSLDLKRCPTLVSFQLFNKLVFLVSFVGNQGTFTRGYKAVVMDMLFIYHLGYAIICVLGLFVHEFFYSFLVRNFPRTVVFRDSWRTMKGPYLIGRYRSLSTVVWPGDPRGDFAQCDKECNPERPLHHSHRCPGYLSCLFLLHHRLPLPQGRLSHGGGPTFSTRSEQKRNTHCCLNVWKRLVKANLLLC